MMNIFVARLNFNTDSDGLRAAFEAFGKVDAAKVINDHFTGKSRGFGFVEMPKEEEALAAIENLNESDLEGSTIVVKKAEPRGHRDSGRSGYKRNSGSRQRDRDHGEYGGHYRGRDGYKSDYNKGRP